VKPTIAGLFAAAILIVPAYPAGALPDQTKVRTYASGLAFPVDMAWVPGTKKIFFTEKNSGRIRVLIGRKLRGQPCIDLDVNSNGHRGALGLVLHPNYDANHFLYVYYTNESPLENRVTRFTVVRNKCTKPKNIVTGLQTENHIAGQLEFVRGKLFVSTGDGFDPAEAQDTSSRHGKVLRVNPNGSIPDDNPFGNAVWAYGHRNPFGLTRRPGTRQIFSTDNGSECDDEFNRIVRGRNYGWGPGYSCSEPLALRPQGPNPKPPLLRWGDAIVPTDPWWYEGRMNRLDGDVYVGDFIGNALHRLVMNAKGTKVKKDRVIFTAAGDIVDVSKGPGGWLYFMTHRSSAAIYRIIPQ
jgi:glucose/arabinose dehydrogenase